jgi:hypothetical protein
VKTLGRILIILAVFVMVMGIAYIVVNASSSSSSTNMPAFERDGNGESQGERPQFPDGEMPAFEHDGAQGGGWMFGLFKNFGIIAIIIVMIAAPRSLMQKKRVPVIQ